MAAGNSVLLRAGRQGTSGISPAWSRWIAPGRIGFMSTQRREDRAAPATAAGRGASWSGSFTRSKDRAGILGSQFPSSAARDLSGNTLSRTAPPARFPAVIPADDFRSGIAGQAATNSLRTDCRNQEPVRPYRFGSPPMRQADLRRSIGEYASGDPPISLPAVSARLHPALPCVPAARRCRTERYDGKGNLHFQHAA